MFKRRKLFFSAIFIVCFFAFYSAADAAEGFVIKGKELLLYQETESEVEIPKKVKIIGKKAFAENKKLKKVTIQPGTVRIKTLAFRNCKKLKSAEIPATVKKIADNSFSGCSKLTIIAEKGSYALKFAKKHGISWKVKSDGQGDIKSQYQITGITCYLYTAGTDPCVAEKKVVESAADFDRIYEAFLSADSGVEAELADEVAGGKSLRVQIDFSDKDSRWIICNAGTFSESGTMHKLAAGTTVQKLWDLVDAEITQEIL